MRNFRPPPPIVPAFPGSLVTVEAPIRIGHFSFKSRDEQALVVPTGVPPAGIPRGAITVRLLCFLHVECEPPPRPFVVKIFTENAQRQKHYTHVMGLRDGQDFLYVSSSEHYLPLDVGEAGERTRSIFLQCDDIQRDHCQGLTVYVSGWFL